MGKVDAVSVWWLYTCHDAREIVSTELGLYLKKMTQICKIITAFKKKKSPAAFPLLLQYVL